MKDEDSIIVVRFPLFSLSAVKNKSIRPASVIPENITTKYSQYTSVDNPAKVDSRLDSLPPDDSQLLSALK